jgi:hypothetical protein
VRRARSYLDALRAIPPFRECTQSELLDLARAVDAIDVPAGTVIGRGDREVVLTLEPTRLLVLGRRTWPTVAEVTRRASG